MECREIFDVREFVKIGVGEDITIRELVELIGDVVGFECEIRYEASKQEVRLRNCGMFRRG